MGGDGFDVDDEYARFRRSSAHPSDAPCRVCRFRGTCPDRHVALLALTSSPARGYLRISLSGREGPCPVGIAPPLSREKQQQRKRAVLLLPAGCGVVAADVIGAEPARKDSPVTACDFAFIRSIFSSESCLFRVFVLLIPTILLTISSKWYNYAEDLKGEGV